MVFYIVIKIYQTFQRYYTENPESGTITKVQSEIDDLKQIMVKNIGNLEVCFT